MPAQPTTDPNRAPLGGIRVLDLSTSVTGFQASQVLADFGAEVVHVEPPGGSPLRDLPSYPCLARGKQSVVLDLKAPADRAIFAPAPGFSSIAWITVPTGMFRSGSALPGRISASAPDISWSPCSTPSGARM